MGGVGGVAGGEGLQVLAQGRHLALALELGFLQLPFHQLRGAQGN